MIPIRSTYDDSKCHQSFDAIEKRKHLLSFSGSYHVEVDIWISCTSDGGGSSVTEFDLSKGTVDPPGHTTLEFSPTFTTTSFLFPPVWGPGWCPRCCQWGWKFVRGGVAGDVGRMDSSANPRSRFRLSNLRSRLVALPFELEL